MIQSCVPSYINISQQNIEHLRLGADSVMLCHQMEFLWDTIRMNE
jgi:hypothetical protein